MSCESTATARGSIDYKRLAHAIAGRCNQVYPGFIDNSMGGYFNHRNGAGADPR